MWILGLKELNWHFGKDVDLMKGSNVFVTVSILFIVRIL